MILCMVQPPVSSMLRVSKAAHVSTAFSIALRMVVERLCITASTNAAGMLVPHCSSYLEAASLHGLLMRQGTAQSSVTSWYHALQATAQGVTSEELERAKRAAIASVYMNLESRAVVAEDIGRQILTYGHRCVTYKH